MKLAFIRARFASTVFLEEPQNGRDLDSATRKRMRLSRKGGSSSINIIRGLLTNRIISECEEWKFWGGEFREVARAGSIPVKLFPCDETFDLEPLANYLDLHGQPEILWVEGNAYPAYLERVFQLCPNSFKIVYSKDWRPHKIERLEAHDLCLVDEAWQVEKVQQRYPDVRCGIWDKLIDYEKAFYPLPVGKVYDICYVAYLRGRKNHELLFQAMSQITDRRLSCVCVGADRQNRRQELQRIAESLNHEVHFVGEVPPDEVNRYLNASRMGVLCARLDAAPRVILEYMAANIPVLVNAELLAGTRYVGTTGGLVRRPEEFHLGICEILDNYDRFSPRAFFLEHYSVEKVLPKFIGILKSAGCFGAEVSRSVTSVLAG